MDDVVALTDTLAARGETIDIVVCNKDLGPIAAIDISNPDERNTSVDREKSERLPHRAAETAIATKQGGAALAGCTTTA